MKKYNLGVEIGCGDRYSSELINRGEEFCSIKLIEPNPILYRDIASAPNPYENISVGNFAITKECREEDMYLFGYCTFMESANSFLQLSIEENGLRNWALLKKKVRCFAMDFLDKGGIDYLILTNNGCELDVLNFMVSRPEIIRTKYYCHNQKHWQYYNQVTAWMDKNGYIGRVTEMSQYGTFLNLQFERK